MGNKIIITGHASGIGHHLAERFDHLGFSVTGIDKNFSEKLNCKIKQIRCNLSDEDEVNKTFSSLNGFSLAVNCAGVSGVRDSICNLMKKDLLNSWNDIFIPTFLSLKEEIRVMNKVETDDSCRIVNVASFTAMYGCKNMLAYSAAKSAIVNLTKVAAVECSPKILINSVSPATIDTPLIRKKYKGELPDYSRTYLTGNCGGVEDVFLAVDMLLKNKFMTGYDLVIDGGFSSNFEVRR